MICGYKWFPHRKGLVSGCIMAGYGLSAFIFDQVETAFINPHNISPTHGYFSDEGVLDRTKNVFFLLAGIFAIMQLVGCFMMRSPADPETPYLVRLVMCKRKRFVVDQSRSSIGSVPSKKRVRPGTKSQPARNATAETSRSPKGVPKNQKPVPVAVSQSTMGDSVDDDLPPEDKYSLTGREAMKTSCFYILWITFSLNVATICYLSTMYKAFAQTFINDDWFLAVIGAVASIFSSLGRLSWGMMMDRWNYKICMFITCGVGSICMAGIYFTHTFGKYFFPPLLWILYFMLGGNYAIFPTACARSFGPKHVGVIYGIIGTALCGGGLIVAILSKLLFRLVGDMIFFEILAVLLALSFVLTFFYAPPSPPEEDEESVRS